jgi:hypothetical protein
VKGKRPILTRLFLLRFGRDLFFPKRRDGDVSAGGYMLQKERRNLQRAAGFR